MPIIISSLLYIPLAALAFNICSLRSDSPESTSIQRIRRSAYPDVYDPHLSISIYELPARLVHLVLAAEDSDFYGHSGYHIGYIKYAARLNKKLGYKAYGASTITQQCARTLFLSPRKTYFRKGVELCIALCLELVIGKDRILELYLSHAEFGPGIYGIAEAADSYYHKPPRELDTEEMLSIISIMPNPIAFAPDTFMQNELLRRRYESLRSFLEKLPPLKPIFRSEIRRIN